MKDVSREMLELVSFRVRDVLAVGTMADAVVRAAASYWEDQPEDFGLLYGKDGRIVFGILNQVVWTPAEGFRPVDRRLCTKDFLVVYDRLGPLPGGLNSCATNEEKGR